MSKVIEVRLPEGYEDATHLIVLAPGQSTGDYPFYATVLKVAEVAEVAEEVQEVGGGGLAQILTDAARVVRTGTAAKS